MRCISGLHVLSHGSVGLHNRHGLGEHLAVQQDFRTDGYGMLVSIQSFPFKDHFCQGDVSVCVCVCARACWGEDAFFPGLFPRFLGACRPHANRTP